MNSLRKEIAKRCRKSNKYVFDYLDTTEQCDFDQICEDYEQVLKLKKLYE